MKTIEDFYKEIVNSKELQEELKKTSEGMLEAFLKKHDCHASVKDFIEYYDAHNEGEIEDGDAGTVAGGIPLLL